MNYYDAVKHFHNVFGHPAADHITLSPYGDNEKDEKLRALRIELIREEVEELEEALADKDIVELADACADILYVTYGAQVAFGMKPRISGLAPRNYKSASISDSAVALIEPIKLWLSSLKDAMADMDIDGVNDSLERVISSTFLVGESCEIDMDAVFAEVQRSNMSKLDPDTGKPILRADGKILKGKSFFRPDIAKVLAQQIDAD